MERRNIGHIKVFALHDTEDKLRIVVGFEWVVVLNMNCRVEAPYPSRDDQMGAKTKSWEGVLPNVSAVLSAHSAFSLTNGIRGTHRISSNFSSTSSCSEKTKEIPEISIKYETVVKIVNKVPTVILILNAINRQQTRELADAVHGLII